MERELLKNFLPSTASNCLVVLSWNRQLIEYFIDLQLSCSTGITFIFGPYLFIYLVLIFSSGW